jgi:alginate O-acetyltransferase complex protein AlgI
MNFVSLTYFIFLTAVFFLYWYIPDRNRNIYLLLVSCIFYACWNWRFLGLIMLSTVVSYFCGNYIYQEDEIKKRKKWLICSIIINLGLLGYFKYADFFINNATALVSFFGFNVSVATLHLVLPIGISFYIFQSLTYPMDIYNRRMQPVRSIIDFSAYVTFFPKLIAGPIVRAKDFLNQLQEKKRFNAGDFQEGCIRILTGFFKKAVIADTLANELVTPIFNNPGNYNSSMIWLAIFGYAMQIYTDFSGYSNIAIGSARIFGFRISENFSFPYLATDFSDFWRRWHISMSSFFRDYIYIPLGGNRGLQSKVLFNLGVTMLLCGLWHGPAWTFVIWGGIHGLLLIFNHLIRGNESYRLIRNATTSMGFSWLITQVIVCLAWVFFRSGSIRIAMEIFYGLIGRNGSDINELPWQVWICMFFVIMDHVYGWLLEHKEKSMQKIPNVCQALGYTMMLIIIYHIIPVHKSPFIYFNF